MSAPNRRKHAQRPAGKARDFITTNLSTADLNTAKQEIRSAQTGQMDKHEQQQANIVNAVGFKAFWLSVSMELGQARLHLDEAAQCLDGFIQEHSDVRTYLHRAIKRTYRESRCQNLDSPISIECVLDTLGEAAYELQTENSGDLFDIELLEEIAWLICDRYADQVTELVARCKAWQCPDKATSESTPAQIISFPDYKIRRANARL